MKRLVLMFLVVFGVSACGGGGSGNTGGSSTTTADKVLASVAMSSGNNQTATVGTQLPAPLIALVLNQAGLPIAGQVVNFVVTVGGGQVFAAAVTSDANGLVREVWTLGTAAGAQKVEVRAIDANGTPVVYATFTATGTAGSAASLGVGFGDGQSCPVLQPLPSQVTAIVTDSVGNPVPGVNVTFTPGNGGSVQPASAVTDATGKASATWTLGSALGNQTLTAAVIGLTAATFNATATVGQAAGLAKYSGDGQTVAQYLTVPMPFTAVVTDSAGNPVPGIPVNFSSSSANQTVNTDSLGAASWSYAGYFSNVGTETITASLSPSAAVTFSVNVTATAHPFDGKYLCSGSVVEWNVDNFFTMVNGIILPSNQLPRLNWGFYELTDHLSASIGTNNHYVYSSTVIVDSLQHASAIGTCTLYRASDGSVTDCGTWSCTRQ